jgi:hypothetical protein
MTEEVRLGVIVPSVNTVVENWYPKIVPDGVSVHFARMLISDESSPEKIIAMDREDGERAIHQIAGRMRSPTAAPHRALSKATRSTNACAPRSGISPRRRRRLKAIFAKIRPEPVREPLLAAEALRAAASDDGRSSPHRPVPGLQPSGRARSRGDGCSARYRLARAAGLFPLPQPED